MFFTMNDPFAYDSATQALDTLPLEYSAGATFDLNFLVVVTDELKLGGYWDAHAEQWEKLLRRNSAAREKSGPSN